MDYIPLKIGLDYDISHLYSVAKKNIEHVIAKQ